MYTINDLYDLTHTLAGDYLARFTYPWEALSDLADCIRALGAQLDSEYLPFGPEVWVHRTAHVAPTASITGPCIIGPETEVRHCAFIRGSALVGAHCVVGNSVELKNVILFDNVQTPHRHRTQEGGRHVGRRRGGGLQQCAEPRQRHRTGQPGISAVLGAGHRAGGEHLQAQRRHCRSALTGRKKNG